MYISRTDSTNTLLRRMIAAGDPPEYIYSGFQTAGRGQTGNGWESEEGKNLLCSVLLPPCEQPFYLNVAVSVAVHKTILSILRHAKPVHSLSGEAGLTIKWPNDIYWGDKKIAGILVETAISGNTIRNAIAGIGLNVNQTEWRSGAPNPVSMSQISGEEYRIDAVMNVLLDNIHEVQKMREEDICAYYRTHLYRKDGFWPFVEREVSTAPTMNAGKETEGIFLAKIEDVRTDGELELRDQDGNLRTYHFKQIRYVL